VNAAKEWEKSQWELANSSELERDQRRYAPQETEQDDMERTHIAESPQIEKAVRDEGAVSKREKNEHWNQKRRISPWTVSLTVVALAACINHRGLHEADP